MACENNSTTTKSKHILKLSTQEKCEFLASFDRICSDVDGVVWSLNRDILGAPEGFQLLKNAGKQLHFISNNSVRPMDNYEKEFKARNMDVNLSEIVHPADSIVRYLKSINFEGLIYIIACEHFKNIIKAGGYQLIDGPNQLIRESFSDIMACAFGGEPVRAVIIDVDFNLLPTKLIRAQIFLRNPECILIAGATDLLLPVSKGLDILGPGYFSKILADVSKKPMLTLAKPGKELAEVLVKRFNITQKERTLMIGDMLEQDVGFGKVCGFQTLVVLTGGCSLNDLLAETDPNRIPDYYADSMGDFVEFMNDVNNANA